MLEVRLMKGEHVLVRARGGRPLKRRVWRVSEEKIFVLSPETYKQAEAGIETRAIGFPREDVFRFDAKLLAALHSALGDPARLQELWESAIPYEAKTERRASHESVFAKR